MIHEADMATELERDEPHMSEPQEAYKPRVLAVSDVIVL